MSNDSENFDLKFENGLYSYPINCPECQESPNAEPNSELAQKCDFCKGFGEITLQLTEEELAYLYQSYLGVFSTDSRSCPYMTSEDQSKSVDTITTCPVSGHQKLKQRGE